VTAEHEALHKQREETSPMRNAIAHTWPLLLIGAAVLLALLR
jgi:hypothetical protein